MEYQQIVDYVDSLFDRDDVLRQKDFVADVEVQDFVPTVDDQAARLLRLLIRLVRPNRILEVGTSVGYSSASMALIVRTYGGRIDTIEYDERIANQAEKNFAKIGVAKTITVLRGDALRILHDLSGEYDMVFQDVDKRLYPLLLEDCVRLLRPGGLLITDDAMFPILDLGTGWSDQKEPVHVFNQLVARSTQLDSVLLPIGDGIMVSVKR